MSILSVGERNLGIIVSRSLLGLILKSVMIHISLMFYPWLYKDDETFNPYKLTKKVTFGISVLFCMYLIFDRCTFEWILFHNECLFRIYASLFKVGVHCLHSLPIFFKL